MSAAIVAHGHAMADTHVVATVGADTLNETVSKEELVVLAVRLVGSLELDIVVLVDVLVNVLDDPARPLVTEPTRNSAWHVTHSVCSGVEVRPHSSKPMSNHLDASAGAHMVVSNVNSLVDLGVKAVELGAELHRGDTILERLMKSAPLKTHTTSPLTLVSVAVPYSSVPQIWAMSAQCLVPPLA